MVDPKDIARLITEDPDVPADRAEGAELVGYSTPDEGYCVHDETGITWGRHPQNYNGPLLFIKDSAGMVTAVGMEVTPEQKESLQDRTLPWDGEIPYGEAVVSGDDALEVINMIGFDHEG